MRRFSDRLVFLFQHPFSSRLSPYLRRAAPLLERFKRGGEAEAGAAPLTEAARFEPAARSAFRALGLGAASAQADVFDAASSVRLALKLGVSKTFETDAEWLFGPASRTESEARDAVGRLTEPAQRARERLFWFQGEAAPRRAPAATAAELMAAVEAALARGGAGASAADGADAAAAAAALTGEEAAALHDAALLALAGLVRLDSSLREEAAWGRAFGLWRRLFACEEFWPLLVAADLKGDYEQAVTYAEVAELRRAAPREVYAPAANLARDAARRGGLREAARAMRLLRGAGPPASLLQEYENEVVGPAEDAAFEQLDRAFTWVEGLGFGAKTPATRRNYCNESWRKFEKLRPRLAEFAELAGADSYAARRVFAHASSKLARLADSFEGAGRREEARFVCLGARALAPPDSEEADAVAERLEALGAGGEAGAPPASWGEYAVAVARELAGARAAGKLFRDDPKGDKTFEAVASQGDGAGCLTSVAFWVALVAVGAGLKVCGVINTRPSRVPIHSLPPLNVRPNLNFNLHMKNYNIPPPLNLRPHAETPGGRRRRRPKGDAANAPPAVTPVAPPTRVERAPDRNAPPPRE
ncbi:MAG TPA: hypothetical protein VF668_07615 [Pyrinomonadaceae bacterium]|jgi:hypothetical protein